MSNQPPIGVPQGAIRLNTDSQKLEFFAQDRWYEMATDVPTLDGGVRGLFGGGEAGANNESDRIDFITISTFGNAQDFGDRTQSGEGGHFASRTRAVCGGASAPTYTTTVDFVTIASTGNATDFGDKTTQNARASGCSNATRGMFAGGFKAPATSDVIDFCTIATTGRTTTTCITER